MTFRTRLVVVVPQRGEGRAVLTNEKVAEAPCLLQRNMI